MQLDAQIEALLFWRGEAMTKRDLSRVFGVNLVAINDALADLRKKLAGRGITLVENGSEVALLTSPEASTLVEKFRKEEMSAELGHAALETLAIILYKNGTTRRELEYIRGVNSTAILRTLLMRGLVSRIADQRDDRVFRYEPTLELFALLGISRVEELPEFTGVSSELGAFEKETEKIITAES